MAGIIGVVGGMGTFAGIDLLDRIAKSTAADNDQEHLPVVMISLPHLIHDRSEYLLGEVDINPGYAIADIVDLLAEAGAGFIAIPCNTAHVPEIVGIVEERLPEGTKLVHMIKELRYFLTENYAEVKKVGILGTNGTVRAKVYDHYLANIGLGCIYPDNNSQINKVHPAIYDPEYGIKAKSFTVSKRSVSDLLEVSKELVDKGADVIVLGCTEIPLAFHEKTIFGVPVIDASDILAKALVRESLRS